MPITRFGIGCMIVFLVFLTGVFWMGAVDQQHEQERATACINAPGKEWRRTANGPYKMECIIKEGN